MIISTPHGPTPYKKIKKQKMANVPRFLYFLVWCGAVWGDRFIITPSEIFNEKGIFYSALVIKSGAYK